MSTPQQRSERAKEFVTSMPIMAIDVIQLEELNKRNQNFPEFLHELFDRKGITWIPHLEELRAAESLAKSKPNNSLTDNQKRALFYALTSRKVVPESLGNYLLLCAAIKEVGL